MKNLICVLLVLASTAASARSGRSRTVEPVKQPGQCADNAMSAAMAIYQIGHLSRSIRPIPKLVEMGSGEGATEIWSVQIEADFQMFGPYTVVLVPQDNCAPISVVLSNAG